MTHRRSLALVTALLVAFVPLGSACVWTDVKIPLDTDLDRTELGTKVGEASTQSLLWLVAWGDGGTQAAAQAAGITTITHADAKVFSVLFGLYSKATTVVYGN